MPGVARFGPYEVDVRSGELRKFGIRVKLGEQPLKILILLMERAGELVTRDELRSQLWSDDTFVDFDHGLNSAVQRLRESLSDTAEKEQWVETVPRRGYRFVAPVEWSKPNGSIQTLVSSEAQSEKPTAVVPPPPQYPEIAVRDGFSWRFAALVVVLVLAGAVTFYLYVRSTGKAKAATIRSIAVLPLENLMGDSSQDYFVDGMTDELITALAENSGLRVISRTSAMQFKGVRRPLRDVARDLGVDGILEGSVSRSEKRVHMTVQLIYAPTDTHIWAESYDRDLSEAVALPTELSQTIAREVRLAVSSPSPERYVNPEAHDAYLHGRYFWFNDNDGPALSYFQKAIQLQPDYAAAWSGVADFYGGRAVEGLISPQEASLYWETDARKAVELDPSLSDAHNSLAAFYFFSAWDVPRAESESKRAVELNPNSSEAFHIYSYILTAMNRGTEAIEAQKSGMEADPFARPWALGYTYYRLRQFDAAMNELRLRELANPKNGFLHDILSDTYHAVGMDKEAVEQWVQSYTVRGDKDSGAAVRRAFERGGYHAAAEWWVTALKQAAPKSYTSSFWLACENARAQHKEEALQQLENAYREHSPRMIFLANEPVFDYLHSEPRYQAIMRSMKVPVSP
jgi:TolB-like protein/DNA-binding winged helix-turn-helix (wHTH) protein